MTVEEAIIAANNGDVNCMMQLGQYYMSDGVSGEIDGKGVREIGCKWYEKAALQGVFSPIPIICAFKRMNATLLTLMDGITNRSVIEMRKEIYDWYIYGYKLIKSNAIGIDTVDINEYIKDIDDARFEYALCLFYAKDYNKAHELVDGFDDIKSKLLLGNIYACNVDDDNYYRASIAELFQPITEDEIYVKKEKEQYEELILALGATYLAEYYAVVLSKYNDSISILRYVRQFIKSDNSIKIIDGTINTLLSNM